MSKLKIQIPAAFDFLFEKARCKVAKGGRGSGKSENIGRYLLIKGLENTENIVCGREFQSSIKDSVHSMLASFVNQYRLEREYHVLDTEIRGENGTCFSFVGLRKNIGNIKSMHNIKRFWGEEAQVFSQYSLDVLFPTIRAEDSELLFSFNPELEEDPAYQYLVVNPPPHTIIRHINYDQNPYFPDILKAEMEDMKRKDYQKYLNIWEGQCKQTIEGAIFTTQLQRAAEEGRISDEVSYEPSVKVHTYWDLGKRNKTAIWFAQYTGMQWRLLKCITGFGRDLEDYMDEIQALPYQYGTHYLPHDARQDRLGMQRSVEEQVRDRLGEVEIVERVAHKINAIEAAKAIFPLCHFHKTNCADGLHDLRRYAYAISEDGKVSKEPDHMYSDVADAWQCFAMAATPDYKPKKNYAPRTKRERDPYEQ